jgi:hypothetical protein
VLDRANIIPKPRDAVLREEMRDPRHVPGGVSNPHISPMVLHGADWAVGSEERCFGGIVGDF